MKPDDTALQASATSEKLQKIESRGYSLQRLPGTSEEIGEIAQIFRDHHEIAETEVGLDATRSTLSDIDLTQYRYIHFATHGVLLADMNIKEPPLVLSYDGTKSLLHLPCEAARCAFLAPAFPPTPGLL